MPNASLQIHSYYTPQLYGIATLHPNCSVVLKFILTCKCDKLWRKVISVIGNALHMWRSMNRH